MWGYYFTNVISSKQRAALGNLTKPLQTLAIECRRGCQQAVECDGPPFNRTNSERALGIGNRTPWYHQAQVEALLSYFHV